MYIMVDYSKAKIYKVLNTVDDDVYIGSTCVGLATRMSKHRAAARMNRSKCKLMTKMNDIGIENFYIELIKEYPECENIEQLRKLEGEYITELQPALNHRVAGRSQKEHYNDNREYIKAHNKQYRIDNRESVLEYERMRWIRDKPKRQAINRNHYYTKRDEILKQQAEMIECECGCLSTRNHLKRHRESKKHIDLMKNKQHS